MVVDYNTYKWLPGWQLYVKMIIFDDYALLWNDGS
jgi:hypothetical protein